MTDPMIAKADSRKFGDLFRLDLFWHSPDHPPVEIALDDGHTVTATNVSSYKGVRVWEIPALPDSRTEAKLDQAIAKKSTNRLVIFHEGDKQVWRWPSRTSKGGGVVSRAARHVHRVGSPDPQFMAKLDAIRLPNDVIVDVNELLSRVRSAFDVETKNETKRASKLMARMYTAVEKGYPAEFDSKKRDHEISATLARILFLLFGDDTEMWKSPNGDALPDLFQDFVKDHTARDGSDIARRINQLFQILDTSPADRSGFDEELVAFPYINGGIFQERINLPTVSSDFRDAVLAASAVDWSTISPAIFGSMFQSVRDARTRRELGEHYTSEENILKTLNPLFLDDLRNEYDSALKRPTAQKKINSLNALWNKLGEIRYLDPACGCGNFIIVAFRELRDLELRIMDSLATLQVGADAIAFDADWTDLLKVTLDHFYGIEIDEWPARIAESAMFLIDRQCDLRMKERFGVAPERLPIQRSARIVVGNALQLSWTEFVAPLPDVVIAGNPPYAGKEQRTASQTADMRSVWGTSYSGEADYVTSWFKKASTYFETMAGRWAFVTTNSICQGVAVGPVFSHLSDHGWHIRFAHRTFQWTSDAAGKAAVHCVIVGMDRSISGRRRLFDYPIVVGAPVELDVSTINAYLIEGPEAFVRERRISISADLGTDIRFGSMPADGGGLIVSAEEYAALADSDPVAVKHLRRLVGAKELLNNKERWCIWMPREPSPDIWKSDFLRARIEQVKYFRSTEARDAGVRNAAATPYRFNRVQQPASEYLCVPAHVPEFYEWFPARRFDSQVVATNANFVLDDPDGLFFAVLSSRMFMVWQKTVGGRIKSDPRFASTVTWNTFPLPPINVNQRDALITAGGEVLKVRGTFNGVSLAALYATTRIEPSLRRAHDGLDEVMDSVFGVTAGSSPTLMERQTILFDRYIALSLGPSSGLQQARPRARASRPRS